jgi:ESS family glutamate:Na+ symporter
MHFETFATFNIAILVLAAGAWLTRKIPFLRNFNIPEPVSSGLLVSLVAAVLFLWFGIEVSFDLRVRDFLLLYFFAGIGLNSDLKTLRAGGWPLVILLSLTLVYMLLQNFTGVAVATLTGLQPLVGLLGGTVSLVGGHGTTIAWAPIFADDYGVTAALEIGVACATLGLVISSLMGGPVARWLITRNRLEPAQVVQPDVGVTFDAGASGMTYADMLRAAFWLNMSVALGGLLQAALEQAGAFLPLFVCSLFAAIILTNTLPRAVPKLTWPAGGRALALISDGSLGIFLAMSLMSLQLWTILDLAGPILAILAAQTVLALLYSVFIVFRFMGRDYEAAVLSAGYAGISLGATPTAMANMTAVTKHYGRAHRAFIILPLVSGFFVDIANALVITRFLGWLG